MRKNGVQNRWMALLLTVMLLMQFLGASGAAEGLAVRLPAAVKTIDAEAFAGDSAIESVIVPDGAERIGARAFADNDHLQTIEIPDSVVDIADDAFAGSNLASIVCSPDGTAAQYAIDHDIHASYTAMPELTVNRAVAALYAPVLLDVPEVYLGTISAENWTRRASADGARTEEIQMSYSTALDDGIVCDITAEYLDGEIGLYIKNYQGGMGAARVTVNAEIGVPDAQGDIPNPSYIDEATISFEIKPEMDANLPTEITISQNRYTVQTGEALELQFADIQLADGRIPDGAQVNRDYFPAAENVVRDEDDESVRFTFNEAGRYILYAYASVNGVDYIKEIAVTVGSADAAITAEQYETLLYIRDGETVEANAATLYFEETGYGGEDMARWEASVRYDGENATTVPEGSFDYALDVDPDGRWADFHIGNPTCAGRIVFAISVNLNDGEYTASREFSVDIEQLTDADMAKQLADMQTVYEVASGDDITFKYDGIQPDVAQDQLTQYADWQREYNVLGDGVEYVTEDENGITFRFEHSGRYVLQARMYRYGISLFKDIYIYVDAENRTVSVSPNVFVLNTDGYAGQIDRYKLAEYSTENCYIAETDQITWSIDNEDAFILIQDAENPGFVKLGLIDSTALAAGEYRVMVSLTIEDENGYTQAWQDELTYTLHAEMPANLPSGIVLNDPNITWNEEADRYELRIDQGVGCHFINDTIAFAENADTELAAYVDRSFNIWSIEQDGENYVEWRDGEVYCAFNVDAIYDIYASISYSSRSWSAPIRVIVGEGARSDMQLNVHVNFNTIYRNELTHDLFASANLSGAERYSGGLEWSLERVDDQSDDGVSMNIRLDVYEDGLGADLRCEYTEDSAEGDVTYRLRAETADGLYSREELIALHVYDSVPGEDSSKQFTITYPEDKRTWHINVGDTITLNCSDIGYDENGLLPQNGVPVWREFWLRDVENPAYQNNVEWNDGEASASVTFNTAGRYSITAIIGFGSMSDRCNIDVVVGDGKFEDFQMDADLGRTYWLNSEFDTYAGSARINGRYLLDGDRVIWTLKRLSDDTNPAIVRIDGYEENRRTVQLGLGNTANAQAGEVIYQLSAAVMNGSEVIYETSREFSANFTDGDLPEEYPTALILNSGVYEYHLTYDETAEQNDNVLMLWRDDIAFDKALPEDMATSFWIEWNDENGDINLLEENGEYFRFEFNHSGRYILRVVGEAGNVMLHRNILVIVNDGIYGDTWLSMDQNIIMLYKAVEGSVRFASVRVENMSVLDGEQITWQIEALGDNASDAPQVTYTVNPQDVSSIDLWADHIANAPQGEYQYQLRAVSPLAGETEANFDFWLIVADQLPANLPTDISVPQTEYTLQAGDLLQLRNESILPVGGDAALRYPDVNVRYTWNFKAWAQYYNNVLDIQIDEPGEYTITAEMHIGSYMLTKDIAIHVRDRSSRQIRLDLGQSKGRIYPEIVGDETDLGMVTVRSDDMQMHVDVWEVEQILADGEEASPAQLRLNTWEGGADISIVNLNAVQAANAYGTLSYRIIAIQYDSDGKTNAYEGSAIVTVVLDQLPEGEELPTRAGVPQDRYDVALGESVYLDVNAIWFADGYVPCGAACQTYYAIDNPNMFRYYGIEIEPTGDGSYLLRFTKNGSFTFRAMIGFSDYWAGCPITIVAGTGIFDDFTVNADQRIDTVYLQSEHTYWVGDAYIDQRFLIDGDDVEWSVADNAALGVGNVSADGESAAIYLLDDAPAGDYTVDVRARVIRNGEAVYDGSVPFQITLLDAAAPDIWPTAITVPQDLYAVQVGDGIDLRFADIAIADGEVPENMNAELDYDLLNLDPTMEWYGIWEDGELTGYHIDVYQECGRCEIYAYMRIGAYQVTAPIRIQVGDGTNPDWGFSVDQKVWRMYKSASDSTWIGSAFAWNVSIYPDEDLVWTAECTNADGKHIAPSLRFETHNNGCNAGVFADNLESATCTEDEPYYYTITVTDPLSGSVRSWDMELWISEAPDQSPLPEDITVQETWNIYAGDMIDFRWDAMQSTGEGALDSYDEQWFAYHFYDDVRTESYQGGTLAWFMSSGDYIVGAMMGIGNIIYTKIITVHVDALPENRLNLELRKNVGALYLDCAEDGFEIASAYVAGDAEIETEEWTATPAGDNGNAELRMEDGWDDGRGQHLRLYNIDQSLFADGEAERTLTFDITATAMQGDAEYSAEGTVSIRLLRNLPDDLPDDLDIESEGYELTLDENGQARLELDYGLIYWFCNGNVPANVQVQYDYWADWDNMTGVAVEHLDYGKTLTFTQAGSYQIQAAAGFNGYWCTHDINITVFAAQ